MTRTLEFVVTGGKLVSTAPAGLPEGARVLASIEEPALPEGPPYRKAGGFEQEILFIAEDFKAPLADFDEYAP